MDAELRRRFLQLLGFDLAAVDLNAMGVKPHVGDRYEISGPRQWPIVRAWWSDGGKTCDNCGKATDKLYGGPASETAVFCGECWAGRDAA